MLGFFGETRSKDLDLRFFIRRGKMIDQMASDESGGAGDEDAHLFFHG